MILRVFIAGLMASLAMAGEQTPMPWISTPTLSPDGKLMVFEWCDDLWTSSSDGGEAKRVVEGPGRDTHARISPDGKRVIFSSDRSGEMQVYSTPLTGGEVTRHTWHTEGNELECVSPDGRRAIVRGMRDRAGFRATRLLEINLAEDRREKLLFDATSNSASYSPDGQKILFTRGGEQLYRKAYRGARASQIWLFERENGRFSSKVALDTESRNPIWCADGKGFYYTSGSSGVSNVWIFLDDQPPRAITDFADESVQLRDVSADGSTLLFHRGMQLFRMKMAGEMTPRPINLWTFAKLPDLSVEKRELRSTTDADFTKDLAQVVFAASGELWWIASHEAPAVRFTQTSAAESEVQFSPNSERLYFVRDDGLSPQIWRASFKDGKLTDEQVLVKCSQSVSRFSLSLNGKKIAWIEGRGDVFVANADGTGAKCVYPCWDKPTYDWSPNGEWLIVAAEDRNANRDLWLVDVAGDRSAVNLTRHPAFDGSPRWSPDGTKLAFSSKRGRDERSRLWLIELGDLQTIALASDVSLQRKADQAQPISTGEIEPTQTIWAADSKSILFQNKKSADRMLRSVDVKSGAITAVTEERGVPIRMTAKGILLWRVRQKPALWDGKKLHNFSIKGDVTRAKHEVLRLAFRRIWRTLGERFYDESMNGALWEKMREKYEPVAASARTSRQFDRVVSLLFGELNASHLSFLRKPWPEEKRSIKREPATAHPGMTFENAKNEFAGGPLIIAHVLQNAPAARVEDPPRVGESIVKIAGKRVTATTPLHLFFNGALGRSLPVVIRSKTGNERVIELQCITYDRARQLDAREKIRVATQRVKKAGDFTYLKVPNMNRDTFDEVELQLYRESLTSNGLVLDVRNNGGGREADRLLALFSQPNHSITRPRDGPDGYPHARRVHVAWNQPLVVLCNEHTYSNAEIFCHAILATKRGPLVGQSTAGGVISAVKSTIPDAGKLQVPFRGWFLNGPRKNLDLNGAKPDFLVEMGPDSEEEGTDPQLDFALQLLVKEVAEANAGR